MERKLGEIFTYNGKIYQVVKGFSCKGCAFIKNGCCDLVNELLGPCDYTKRTDKTNVIFKEINNMEIKNNQLTIDIPEGMEIDLETVANEYSQDNCGYSYNINKLLAFKAGAKWAINEFLKNLWHPASEEPNIKQGECCVTCLVKFKNESTELCVYFRNPEGWVCDDMSPKDFKRNFKGWLYIDDLFLKEGDKQ